MLLLSELIDLLIKNCFELTILFSDNDNNFLEFIGPGKLVKNINKKSFIEELLSKNLVNVTIRTKYFDKNPNTLNHLLEKSLIAFNINNQMSISKMSVIIENIDGNTTHMLDTINCEIEKYKNTIFDVFQLKQIISDINLKNEDKVLKIKNPHISYSYDRDRKVVGHFEKKVNIFIFNCVVENNINYEIAMELDEKKYDSELLLNYSNKIDDFDEIVNKISSNITTINSSLNKELFLYFADLMTYSDTININVCENSSIYEVICEKHFEGLVEIVKKIKDSDFKDDKYLYFLDLLISSNNFGKIPVPTNDFGEFINNWVKILNNSYSFISIVNEYFSLRIRISFYENSTRFLSFIYSDELVMELEKLIISGEKND